MALRVWLPLTGSLENKGISAITATTFETPTYVAGKIGQCYQRANSNSQLTNGINLNSNLMDILGTQASIAVWVKPLGTHTHYNGTIASSGNWNAKKWAFGVSQDNSKVDVLCGSYNTYITCAVPTNEWTHLVSTFDNGTCKLYKNGEYVGQLTGQKAFETDATNACIARETYASGYFGFNGCVNDVRIYDHCLSAAEVKEISQGLVLHYKLDEFQGGLGNPNLYTGSRDFSGSWVNSGNWTTATETYQGFTVKQRSGTWGGLAQNITCTQNDIFTVSFYAKVDSGGQIMSIHRSSLGNVTTGLSILGGNFSSGTNWIITTQDGTQWKRYWATVQITSADITYLQWRIENNQSGKNLYVCGMKLEKGSSHTGWSPAASEGSFNTIQDSSGYGHNGTIYGTTQLVSGPPRYSTAIELTSTSSHINASGLTTSGFGSSYSFVWWAKSNSTTNMHWGFSNGIRLNGLYNGNLWNTGDGSNNPLYKPGTTTGISVTEANVWHHWAMTGDGTTCKVYKDGVHVANAKTWKAISGTSLWFNGWQNSTSYATSSLALSDFRLYATALSAEDILSLYHTAAKVDNLHNIHTFEYLENNDTAIKLTKAGQFKTTRIQEDFHANVKNDNLLLTEPDGSTWIHVFHHNNPAGARFTDSASDWSNGKYIDADRWYNLECYLNNNPSYEFLVKQKTTSSATETKYRWIQTPNPLTATWTDVKPGTVTFITTSGYSSSSYGGMYLMKNSNLHMCIANGSNGNWFGGIDAAGAYNGGILGYPNTTVTSGYIDLYIRVYINSKIVNNNYLSGNNLIEK